MFKQKTAYELRIRDWSSEVCSPDLLAARCLEEGGESQRFQPLAHLLRRFVHLLPFDAGAGVQIHDDHVRLFHRCNRRSPGMDLQHARQNQTVHPFSIVEDRKRKRLNSSPSYAYRMPPSSTKNKHT